MIHVQRMRPSSARHGPVDGTAPPAGGGGTWLTPDLLYYNFENGIQDPRFVNWNVEADNVADGNALEGSWAGRFKFFVAAATPGHISVDRHIDYDLRPLSIEHAFINGAFKYGTPLAYTGPVQRKLLYIMGDVNNAAWALIITTRDYALELIIQQPTPQVTLSVAPRFVFTPGTYYRIETEILPNTLGNSDGYIKLWIYDATVSNELHRQTWSNLVVRTDTTKKIETSHWGEQVDRLAAPIAVDEYRWWDNIGISTFKCGQPTNVPGITGNISLGSDGAGRAATQANIAAATSISMKMRVRGDKLTTATAGAADLLSVYEGATNKIAFNVGQSGSNVVLESLCNDSAGYAATSGYPTASIDPLAFYRIYIAHDKNGTGKELTLFDDSGTVLNTVTGATSFSLPPALGGVSLGVFPVAPTNANGGTYDWVGIYSAALSGAARYAKPASGDATILSGWDFNEGTGTSAANIVGGANALTLSGTYNWL